MEGVRQLDLEGGEGEADLLIIYAVKACLPEGGRRLGQEGRRERNTKCLNSYELRGSKLSRYHQ